MALLDHERRRKRCRPLHLRTPQRKCEPEGRRGERKRWPRARGGQRVVGGSPEWLSAVSAEPARAPWSGSPMWPNLRSTRTHERKVTRVFRAGPGKCGACAGAPSPREKRSGPAGCSTYLPLEQRCSDAVENERVGAQLQVHEIEPVSISRRHPAPPEQLPQRAHRPILHARVTSW